MNGIVRRGDISCATVDVLSTEVMYKLFPPAELNLELIPQASMCVCQCEEEKK